MNDFSKMAIAQLLRPEGFSCVCGKCHTAAIRQLEIGPGVLDRLAKILRQLGSRHPMVVCGPFGYEAAGKAVCALLEQGGTDYTLHVIPCKDKAKIKPAEFAAGSLLLHYDHACDLVLGVGSGVINDLCKVLSTAAKVPCMIVATAPSMDGYASDSSSMEVGGIKCSLKEQMPAAILCDTELMARAPMHMLHAGLGDILAKYTSLCDWRLSNIVTGEYYCDAVAGLVRDSLARTVDSAPGLLAREESAVRAVTEGLVLSGIGIAFAGTSHPASGLDHYFSHCWEMMLLERGEDYELHGIQVGIGMLITLRIARQLKSVQPDMARAEAAADRFDEAAWETNLRRVFPKSADGILAIEQRAKKNERTGRLARARRAIERWDEIMALLEDGLPDYEQTEALMRDLGMPTRPGEIGLTTQDVVDAFVCSRDIRDKYLLSSLIWDLGYMEDFAAWLQDS